MKREFLQSFKVGDQPLPKEVIDAIMEKNGQDIQTAKQASQDWEDKYNRAVQSHAAQLAQLRLENAVETAVSKAGGRSVKAITALLDMEAIAAAEDVPKALEQALTDLKQDSGYLFEAPTPPPYARFTGGAQGSVEHLPATLAGALRERMQTN